jgi:hypothetical protein
MSDSVVKVVNHCIESTSDEYIKGHLEAAIDTTRIEKAPKPVVRRANIEITVALDNGRLNHQEYEARIVEGAKQVFQVTIVNGQIAKWEEVK